MSACARSYGVCTRVPYSETVHDKRDLIEDTLTTTAMANDQLIWLIKKDDLILSSEPKEATAGFTQNFTENSAKAGTLLIYAYDGDRDSLPDRLGNSESGLSLA